jgi:lipopolysaccharide transport system ATP-binding protein
MSEIVIRAVGLTKIFRLYSKPHYRFLDMFGLLRAPGAYQEHAALNSLDMEIRRGEKVAFIGRNGAGKSTLLRLITGVTQPSSGTLEVRQGANALLQIGTGFHPDFSGRENARAYLAHLGVAGRAAEEKIMGIVDFSELEEYIDQPVKTYSSGMMARLMFATSTAIAPDLLVLDEILGVGDAYFANKSFERIK